MSISVMPHQLAHRLMDMEEIDALFLLLNMGGKILIVGRSRANELDVAELLKNFGGGGHPVLPSYRQGSIPRPD